MTAPALEPAALEQMIHQQLRAWDVLDPAVLEVFARVPRERFVPEGYISLAYADIEVPLVEGWRMFAPKVAGRIVQAVAAAPTDRVLLVGAGSGYLAACLAAQACSVRALEIRADLAATARHNLESAGVRNVTVVEGDAFAPEALGSSVYEIIVLSGSLPILDERFTRQLAIGGRLFVIVGEGALMEALLIERTGPESWQRTVLFETVRPALDGAPTPSRFSF